MSAEEISRYHALLKVCDLACAHATTTGADRTPEFWETIAAALQDDCPTQSRAATSIAATLRAEDMVRSHFFKLLADPGVPPGQDGDQQPPLA